MATNARNPDSGTEVDKKTFSFLANGDVPIDKTTIKSIRVDAFTDVWFAFQENKDGKCRGDLLTQLKDGECIKTATLGIGCTRLCSGGLGGGACASNQKPL